MGLDSQTCLQQVYFRHFSTCMLWSRALEVTETFLLLLAVLSVPEHPSSMLWLSVLPHPCGLSGDPEPLCNDGACACWDTVSAAKHFQIRQREMLPRLTLPYHLGCQIVSLSFSPPLLLLKTILISLVSLRRFSGVVHFEKTRTGSYIPCLSPANCLSQFLMAHLNSSL